MLELSQIINLKKKIKRFNEGFAFITNKFYDVKKYDDNFIQEFNSLINDVFDEYSEEENKKVSTQLFSEQVVKSVKVIRDVLPKILKESYFTEKEKSIDIDYPDILIMLKESIKNIILKESEDVTLIESISTDLSLLEDRVINMYQQRGKDLVLVDFKETFKNNVLNMQDFESLFDTIMYKYLLQFYYLYKNSESIKTDEDEEQYTTLKNKINRIQAICSNKEEQSQWLNRRDQEILSLQTQ